MSEEQESQPAQAEENPVEETPAPTPEPAAASAAAAERDTSERLMKKLNLVAGESIDSDSVYRPAPLSFTSRYILAFGVLLVHLLFWWFDKFSADSDAAAAVDFPPSFVCAEGALGSSSSESASSTTETRPGPTWATSPTTTRLRDELP